eukprot:COSAG01_NODE_5894_length_3965_cov_2.764615_7_plen_56_part_00
MIRACSPGVLTRVEQRLRHIAGELLRRVPRGLIAAITAAHSQRGAVCSTGTDNTA